MIELLKYGLSSQQFIKNKWHLYLLQTLYLKRGSLIIGSSNYRYKFQFAGNTRFDSGGNFKSTFGCKSGIDTNVDVAVAIIANPPPQTSDFTWDGPVPVSFRTTISRGDVIYKHVLRSSIPVKDRNYFGNYTLSYNGEIINKITIYPEGSIYLHILKKFK